jgi:branched-chain amino acid transport system permease protein
VTALPQAYRVERGTRLSRLGALGGAGLLALLVAMPWIGDSSDMRIIGEIAYYLALAQMWNLLAGYAGLVSVGQQAFVGLGGYALFVFAAVLGVPPLPALLLAALAAAVIAIPTAFVVFRLRGAYFAIGTWVVAEVYRLLFAQTSSLGGGSGMSLPADIVRSIGESRAEREMVVYWVALAIGVAAVALVYLLLRSRHGLALTAIRDSEVASESLGVDNFKTKLSIYVVAAFGTGLAGALIYLQKLRISPDAAFNIGWTADIIFIVVIGGIGTIEGPILGVLVFFVLRELLADYGTWYMIVLGAVAVAVMLKAPQGAWGLVAERFDLHFFPVQRRLRLGDKAAGTRQAPTQKEVTS